MLKSIATAILLVLTLATTLSACDTPEMDDVEIGEDD
jgi:hypothetical protein